MAPHLFAHPWLLLALILPLAALVFHAARSRKALFLPLAAVFLAASYILLPAPPWFAVRYMAPVILVETLFLAGLLGEKLSVPFWGRISGLALAVFLLGVSIFQHLAVWPSPHPPEGYHAEALRLKTLVPPGTRIGSFQAGVLSYFLRDQVVVNLDGVMGHEALASLKAARLGEFLRESGVEYVADWTTILDRLFWPLSGLKPGRDAVLVDKNFFDLWKLLPQTRDQPGTETVHSFHEP